MARAQSKWGQRPDVSDEGVLVITLIDKENGNAAVDTYSPDLSTIDPSIRPRIFAEGVSRILQQRHSGVDGPDKFAAYAQTLAEWAEGKYIGERAAGFGTVRIEIEALAEMKSVSVRDIQASLKDYSAEERERIYASAQVQEMVAAIRARGQTAPVSLADLL